MRRPFSNPPSQRWPLVTGGPRATAAGHTKRRGAHLVLALVPLVLALLMPGLPLAMRGVVLGVGLLPLALLLLRVARPIAPASGTVVECTEEGIVRRTADGEKSLGRWDDPFGVTVLASYARPTALLAFTSASQTRYVPMRIDERTDDDDTLFAKFAVLADIDLVDGVAHEAALPAAAAAAVLRHIAGRDAEALRRFFLSDGKGTPIVLSGARLTIGDRHFDLGAALTWRALMFHESAGQGAALYQGTALMQGDTSVVLVAPMPASIVPRDADVQRDAKGDLGRALTRHLRLLKAEAESPPARELRVAIDRPFMMAVRRALDEAPLAQATAVLKARPPWDASTSRPRSTT